MKELGQMKIMV